MISQFFESLFGVIWSGIQWIGNLIRSLFQTLIDLIVDFFQLIYALIDGILYFIYHVGTLAVKLFLIFFELGKLIIAFFVGLGKTLASLTYTPMSTGGHGYSEMIGKIFLAAEPLQLNVIAYILLFLIWMVTAIGSIMLISSIRVGGD